MGQSRSEPAAAIRQLIAAGRFGEAEALCRGLLSRLPLHPEASGGLVEIAGIAGQIDEAERLAREAMAAAPHPRILEAGVSVLRRARRHAAAAELCELGLEDAATRVSALKLRSSLRTAAGEPGALEDLEAALSEAPSDPDIHHALTELRTYRDADDPHIAELRGLLAAAAPGRPRRRLAFALARALDRCGEHQQAFERVQQAHAVRRGPAYNRDRAAERVRRLRETYDRSFFEAREAYGRDDPRPIFVVGLPRSGSSLVERILSSHSDVVDGGERDDLGRASRVTFRKHLPPGAHLPESVRELSPAAVDELAGLYLTSCERIAPGAARVVDKQLGHTTRIGMIALALPGARIIHVDRDPMDCGLSCYLNSFSSHIPFAEDLEAFAHAYRCEREMLLHWQSVVGDRLLQVELESLIEDPGSQIRRMIEHIGLPWDDACLSPERAGGITDTLSAVQVRSPINSSGVGRWNRYAEALAPLRQALTEELSEIDQSASFSGSERTESGSQGS